MEKKTKLIFAHGWAFHSLFFTKLADFFKECECLFLDQGYFGSPSQGFKYNELYVGIGHSLGFAKLIKCKAFNWAGLISIGGFSKFVQNQSINTRLTSMITKFEQAPQKVLSHFYASCELKQYKLPHMINKQKLYKDLYSLLKIDVTDRLAKLTCPVLSLHAKNDKIVPIELHKFTNAQNIIHNHGGHGLGMNNPGWCAEKIRDFLDTIC